MPKIVCTSRDAWFQVFRHDYISKVWLPSHQPSLLAYHHKPDSLIPPCVLKDKPHCYYACDVTLSVYPHRASLKNMPDHGGNQTYNLWNTSPMLCQLSYAVWSVRVCDISEQNLVPSISM